VAEYGKNHNAVAKSGSPPGRIGRPRAPRVSASVREDIRHAITAKFGSLSTFYEAAFEAAKTQPAPFSIKPADIETVRSAYAHFLSGRRTLPTTYWNVLGRLIESPPLVRVLGPDTARPRVTRVGLGAFELATNTEMPQWASHQKVDLKGGRLIRLLCTVATDSPYFRFGLKLLAPSGRLFGDGGINSTGNNVLVHVGRNNYDRPHLGITTNDLFFTQYINGVSPAADQFLFSMPGLLRFKFDFAIDESSLASLTVNGLRCFARVIDPEIRKHAAVFAWGDRDAYHVSIEEATVDIELGP
jgi:hypothetical protein